MDKRAKILVCDTPTSAGGVQHYFYCPGCKCGHAFTIGGGRGWSWNGDREKPDVNPSVRVFDPGCNEPGWERPEKTLCHLFIRNGMIEFLNDCDHELRGQAVPVADWPENYGTKGLS